MTKRAPTPPSLKPLTKDADCRVSLADRFASADVGKVRKTDDGYLTANPRVARIGIQLYNGSEVGRPDLKTVRVYRSPAEVFSHDAMKSLAHRPVTVLHPPESVTARTWGQYAVGHSADEVLRDGNAIRVPMVLMDQRGIDAFERGAKEISVGYTTDLKWGEGKTPEGETYDAIQTAIRGNHIALVPAARGGKTLRFGDGRQDAFNGDKLCPHCGEEVSSDADTCPECDFDFGDDTHLGDAGMRCDDCGTVMTKDADTCPGCRKTMGDKDFSDPERNNLAKSGKAMPGGGYPIENVADLKRAIQAFGRAKDPAATKAWIKKRAKELDAEKELPDDWVKSTTDAGFGSTKGSMKMAATITVDGAPVQVADETAGALITNHIARLSKQVSDATKAIADAKAKADEDDEDDKKTAKDHQKALDALTGQVAALTAQLKDATEASSPDKLDALVKDRATVIAKAATIVGDAKAFEGKKLSDIRRAVVVAKIGDAAAKDMNDDAIEGAFNVLSAGKIANGGLQAGALNIGRALFDQQRNTPGGMSMLDDARAAALADSEKSLNSAWQTKRA